MALISLDRRPGLLPAASLTAMLMGVVDLHCCRSGSCSPWDGGGRTTRDL
jgi:hypothetical protein